MVMENKDVMPAGSLPPEIENEEITEQPVEPQTPPVVEEPPKLLLGKFKTQEDLASAYKDLEGKLGQQGTEVGNLRKQVELASQMLSNQQTPQGKNTNDRVAEIDSQLKLIEERGNAGDLTTGEAATQAAQLAAEKATIQSTRQFQQILKQNKAEEIQTNFIKNNPDFKQLQQDGTLDQIKAENPLHDNFSAYMEYKGRKVASDAQAKTEEAYKKGLAEGTKLKEGIQPTTKVLSKPGGNIRQVNQQPVQLKGQELTNSMLDTLRKFRGQGT